MKKDLHRKNMEIVKSLVEKRKKENNIKLAVLGGSVARGDENEHSDIDINFYVDKSKIPEDKRRFYRFKDKYIEEIFMDINQFDKNFLIGEEIILFDSEGFTKNRKFKTKFERKKEFNFEMRDGEKHLRLAERYYKDGKYEKALLYLLGTKSYVFIFMHSLPKYSNLSFPSFRLLNSVKKIDRKSYNLITKMFFTGQKDKFILNKYSKAYKLMAKIYRKKYSNLGNYGFFDKLKIKYNLEGLGLTYHEYLSVYANRFIVGCVVDWALDYDEVWKVSPKNREKMKKLMLEILGLKEITREFVEEKLNLSNRLKERVR